MRTHLSGRWPGLVVVAAVISLGSLGACGASGTTTPDAAPLPAVDAPPAPIDAAPAAIDAAASIDARPAADAGGVDAAAACDPVTQTGCPAPKACTLAANGTPVCAAAGTTATGASCASATACVPGNLCVQRGPAAGENACTQFCSTDPDCMQPAAGPAGNVGRCILALNGTSYTLCTTPCNPVAAAGPSGCPTGLSCEYFGTPSIPELTDCGPAGTLAEGGTCTQSAPCAPGLICVGSGTSGTCREVCRAGMNGDCTVAGDTCASPAVTTPMFGFCCPAAGC